MPSTLFILITASPRLATHPHNAELRREEELAKKVDIASDV